MASKYSGPIERIDATRWRIPVGAQRGMRVEGII